MQRTFLYIKIQANDVTNLKKLAAPHTKDFFAADPEYIVVFENTGQACKVGIDFLEQARESSPNHDYKVVLLNGDFSQKQPLNSTLQIARTVHEYGSARCLYFTEDILSVVTENDASFDKSSIVNIVETGQNIQTYTLTAFGTSEISVDRDDLFDFSNVEQADQPKSGEAKKFHYSDEALELDPKKEQKPIKIEESVEEEPEEKPKAIPKLPPENPEPAKPKPRKETPTAMERRLEQASRVIENMPAPSFRSLFIVLVVLGVIAVVSVYIAKTPTAPPKNVFTLSKKD